MSNVNYAAGLDLISVVDVNGDGDDKPDIVGANADPDFSRVAVFLNQGNDTYG